MSTAQHDRSIDPAFIARITRAVIARLRTDAPVPEETPAVESIAAESMIENDPAFEAQLQRRGVALPAGSDVVWTDQPATAVFEQCRSGRRAVMVSAFSDVERFTDELSPEVWVLDRKKLNLVAAVNAAARIAHLAALGGSR